jgi:hypothetical protein
MESMNCLVHLQTQRNRNRLARELLSCNASSEKKKGERWFMKFRNMIRMQVMTLAGLGMAMLFAGSAYAQQEMDPASFADGPNMERMAQPTASAYATTTSAPAMTPVDAERASMSIATPSQVENAAVWTPLDQLSLSALIVFAACILLYEISQARRIAKNVAANDAAYLPRRVSML